MRVRTGLIGVLLLASAATVFAQSSTDRSFTTTSKTCEGIKWSQDALAQYPFLSEACRSVEERNGKTFVKFQGTVERNNLRSGKELELRIKDGDVIKVTPPENMVVYINDRRTPVANLSRGDELNFYVPEDRFAAQFAQDTTPAPQFVAVPIVYREVRTTEETPTRTAAVLPSTATNQGLTLIFAAVLLAFAGTITMLRRQRR